MKFFAVPTGRGLLFLFLTLAALAVAFMNSGLITAFTAAALSAMILSSFLMAHFSLAGVTLERSFPHQCHCKGDLYIDIAVKNHLPFYRQEYLFLEDLPFLHSRQYAFTIPALAPNEKMNISFLLKAEKRGEYSLEDLFLCSGDPLGLFRKKKLFKLPAFLVIHPAVYPLESLAVVNNRGGLPNAEGRALNHAGKGPEFFGVRPYREGDEVRHIHWKSTASKGKLMVKEFEAAAVDQIVILLDTEKRNTSMEEIDNNFEFLISCASSITEYLSKKYCHLRFIASDGLHEELHHISGDAASVKGRIQQTLTLIQNSNQKFSQVLAAAAESIMPGSIVYILSMSKDSLAEYAGILEEQDCFCFWLYAPPQNFPPIEKDKPRILKKAAKEEELLPGDSLSISCTADFRTKTDEILKSGHQPYEKL